MNDQEKKIDPERREQLAWRQILIVMAGSFGLALVCCGGAFALDGARNSTLSSIGYALGMVGIAALAVSGLTLVGAVIAGVIFNLIRR